jgi:pyruvate dehydrogenase E2 component (dihydrolipoamide acetyltransferase)
VAAGSVYGDVTHAGSQADDEMINLALGMGLGADLGIGDGRSEMGDRPPTQPANSELPTPISATPAETPQQKRERLTRELAALDEANTLAPEGTPPGAGAPASAAAPAVPPLVFTPTPENPLVNLRTPEHLAITQDAATQLRAWAIEHRTDGGTLPLPLAQLIENAEAARLGRPPATLSQAPEIPPEAIAHMEVATERMLTSILPQRREVIAGHQAAAATLRQENPAFLDPAKEEHQLYRAAAREFPALLNHPSGPLILRDLVTGILANRAKTAAPAPAPAAPAPAAQPPALKVLPPPTVPTTDGQRVPLAPGAAIGGLAAGGPPVSQAALDAAMARMEAGKATDDDLITLSHAAV